MSRCTRRLRYALASVGIAPLRIRAVAPSDRYSNGLPVNGSTGSGTAMSASVAGSLPPWCAAAYRRSASTCRSSAIRCSRRACSRRSRQRPAKQVGEQPVGRSPCRRQAVESAPAQRREPLHPRRAALVARASRRAGSTCSGGTLVDQRSPSRAARYRIAGRRQPFRAACTWSASLARARSSPRRFRGGRPACSRTKPMLPDSG